MNKDSWHIIQQITFALVLMSKEELVYDVTNNFCSRCFVLGFLDALK